MSRKFKEHYENFNRYILAEFLTEKELNDLDERYNQAKANRELARLKKVSGADITGKTGTCCFCKKPYNNFGNNALPVKDGRCCDNCNDLKVLPARFEKMGYAPKQAKQAGELINKGRKIEKKIKK